MTDQTRLPLGGMSAETFLRDYWQKKPLLIRGAFPDFQSPLEPDELAGLACEDNVEARLVELEGPDKAWQVSHGPFDDETFARLGRKDWSLLVQAVDHYVPDVAELLEHFTFIPRWRLDDIMASFAPPGGNVGAHVDNYDVFLLQASGQRRWQLGDVMSEDAPIIDGIDLRILADFQVIRDQDWVLEPGDMLYLPPRVAHHGISQSEDCMTFSVGFRAPSMDEMVTSWADYLGEQLEESSRYHDPDLEASSDSALINDVTLARVREQMLAALDNPEQMAQWFGRTMTQVKYPDQLMPPATLASEDTLTRALEEGDLLEPAPGSRLAWHPQGERATLFVDGDGHACSPALARRLTGNRILDQEILLLEGAGALLVTLINCGSLRWVDEDEDLDDDDEFADD
ncbi:cupin domain-containing protein [Kushneria marisflavi]|uniref:Transcription factor n=1 Tax=Kushneria marisflavi TaxID=157779 RepID=A0A240USK2_9GAMM|nr:cupin domain-containing protein [Kushneria marisflavi]ART64085.1 transcription factor [Kushneria marisflavi]RKD85824.1 50S ribosomal protein L16 3-hydroxylase [Kushneria marisflavi]